jgi:hypothetical protein
MGMGRPAQPLQPLSGYHTAPTGNRSNFGWPALVSALAC